MIFERSATSIEFEMEAEYEVPFRLGGPGTDAALS